MYALYAATQSGPTEYAMGQWKSARWIRQSSKHKNAKNTQSRPLWHVYCVCVCAWCTRYMWVLCAFTSIDAAYASNAQSIHYFRSANVFLIKCYSALPHRPRPFVSPLVTFIRHSLPIAQFYALLVGPWFPCIHTRSRLCIDYFHHARPHTNKIYRHYSMCVLALTSITSLSIAHSTDFVNRPDFIYSESLAVSSPSQSNVIV